jgi:hypothetical protein
MDELGAMPREDRFHMKKEGAEGRAYRAYGGKVFE